MTNLLPFELPLDSPLLLAGAGAGAALALGLTSWAAWRKTRTKGSANGAVAVAALAAIGSTAYSADTSWAFAADYLDIAGTAERAALFGTGELSLFATALMARQNLATQGSAGLPGTLVWVITGVQVIPAYAESGVVGGTVRAFIGPVMAATLWHLAMGIELRLRTPGAASRGLLATLGREVRERALSRLGIAARDRDAAQITRERAITQAVALATRLADRSPERRQSWRGRRLTRRLSRAIGRSAAGTDPDQRARLLAQLAARRHALTLATSTLPSPWHLSIEEAAAKAGRGARGDRGPGTSAPGTEHHHDRGPGTNTPGTEHHHDRGPGTNTPGTEHHHDRGPGTNTPGTEHHHDRGPGTSLRRKPTPRVKASRPRSSGEKRRGRDEHEAVTRLVEQVRPHVPALLERDGNEAVTRVQLREILRREQLTGGRNDRLSLVLQELRSGTNTTRRSTAR
ncbi:hypothetical protein [Streptomyces sp. GZWMJZ-114]|uniref:hypothetical protein n=1 Tax=Streptomyces sp. GZWMJZ-114 TaxID=2494734 RepID=UPI00101374CB|nr:hypothetical protein [Streptomyces sp. GZWMJZ-114]